MKQRSALLIALFATFTTTATFADGANEPTASRDSSITITEQRLGDQRVQAAVMDALARNDSLAGKVGVESQDRVVNLSGYLTTAGQVMRAGRTAAAVNGVRYVVNEIRPKVGAVTY